MARNRAADIEAALQKVVDSTPPSLRAVVTHALAPPAKRLRPRVALLAFQAAGGTSTPDGMRIAVAVELFHAASLLVDDVVDGSASRRGRPAAHVAHGVRATLLAAGILMNRGQRLAAGDDEIPALDAEEVRVFRDAIDLVLQAEAAALEAGSSVGLDEWIEIARGKTGALFMASAEAAARCAGASDDILRALRRYGMSVGVAFQAADDVLDVTGDPARTGKPAGTDIALAPNLARVVGVEEALSLADRFARDAENALEALPKSLARDELAAIARAAARRDA